jgi:DNA-binding NarL/FixJ family response regulator
MKKTPVTRAMKPVPPRSTIAKKRPSGGSTKPSAIRVALADDHTFVREALRSLLSGEEDVEIVAEADNGRRAIEIAEQLHPSVLLMDIGMPRLNGLAAAQRIRHVAPEVKVILLTAFGTDHYIQEVVNSGIPGYLLKDAPCDLLLRAIREVAKGHTFHSPAISQRMRSIVDTQPNGGKSPVRLTTREIEVLQLIAEGAANKQIAAELEISIKTVEKHRQNLMDKLRIHDTASLTRYAISSGVIDNAVQTATPV